MTVDHPPLADAEARAAINGDLDATLIVEAAAGTGKTTALVGRIVQVLAEGRATVDAIVAVTFTEKAAGELKLRLRERLDRARTAAETVAHRDRLDAALMGLEEAHVSTIHGFCADLLRERPVEARVDPLFEVLTEPASARLFDEAFGLWLQEQLADPPEGIRRALRRPSSSGDEGPIDRLRGAAWELAQWRDFPEPWQRPDFDRERTIDAALAELHDVAALTRNPAAPRDPLHEDTEPIRRVSDEIALQRSGGEDTAQDYDGWEAALVELSRRLAYGRPKTGRGTSYAAGVPRARVLEAREALKIRLDRLRMDADADLAALLQRELRGAIERYAAAKARAGALDFLDLLLGARNLVRDNARVRCDFQERFKRIFVDEFQDTDPLQAEILLLLAADNEHEADWRKARPRPGTLFLVGDPKQSIYRFRRADVGVYREVCERLVSLGARPLQLNTSFRSVPGIQACVNAAFAPIMTGDQLTLQAPYVPLAPDRPPLAGQPALVVLPVPEPYKWKFVSAASIEASLPGAVGAFVDWIVHCSGWRVTERSGGPPVPVAARHVCLLFRRFVSWANDVTRPYVEALESRGIPHVLVGGRAFHEREEVEAIRAALAAIEWPDDELSVFATLRGPFFAIADETLLEWAHRFGQQTESGFRRFAFHPFRVPAVFDGEALPDLEPLRPIAAALSLLKRLHRRRNYVPVAETLHELLGATRAHVGFALRTGGEQALANVLHVAELARQFDAGGGISFRGFVDELRVAAERAQAAEAPILEEDSDGVRMMTVHKAKGLEFPIVVLVDLTCKLSRQDAGRWIDADRGCAALRIGGWSPVDLLLHGAEEAARDRAEGQRLAYVAATRARDVLVVPAVGDEPYEGGWLDPLTPAVYPPLENRRHPLPAEGCPAFASKDSVLTRAEDEPAGPSTVAPGRFRFDGGSAGTAASPYDVVWWDPRALALDAASTGGLRRDDLIAKDGDQAGVARLMGEYRAWQADRAAAIGRARVPTIVAHTATALARDRHAALPPASGVEVVDLPRDPARPYGPAFGRLVHATLATVALGADPAGVARVAATQARILVATEQDARAAAAAVSTLLAHPLLARVREADAAGRCQRECPILWRAPDGAVVDGTADAVFEEADGFVVLDFKTDRDPSELKEQYERQLGQYVAAVAALRGRPAKGILVRL